MKALSSLFTVLFIIVFLLVPKQDAHADFFKYKDNNGDLIITDRFENVPKKYRNRVKVVWDADLEAKDPVARRRTVAKEQYEQQEAANKARQEAEKKAAAEKAALHKKLLLLGLAIAVVGGGGALVYVKRR